MRRLTETTRHEPVREAGRPTIEIHRMPLTVAEGWQREIAAEVRRQRVLTPSVFNFLKGSYLLERCTFLASESTGGPLLFRYLGVPTLSVLGRDWGEAVLNQADDEDPHTEFSHSVGAQYADAIGSGEPIFNHIVVTGIGRPFTYTHLLYGWSCSDRRAVLSAVQLCIRH